MDIFQILILILLTYLVYTVSFTVAPALKLLPRTKPKSLKGAVFQADFLLVTGRPLPVEEFILTKNGLNKSFEIDAIFKTLNNDYDVHDYYGTGKLTIVRDEFFKDNYYGDYGIISNVSIVGNIAQGILRCSDEFYKLIRKELLAKRPTILRTIGATKKKMKKGDPFDNPIRINMVELLTVNSISGPRYFVERFRNYLSSAKIRNYLSSAPESEQLLFEHFSQLLTTFEASLNSIMEPEDS